MKAIIDLRKRIVSKLVGNINSGWGVDVDEAIGVEQIDLLALVAAVIHQADLFRPLLAVGSKRILSAG